MSSFKATKKHHFKRPKHRKPGKRRKLGKRPRSHHDHFFRFVFSQVEHARGMLKWLVGAEIARRFDWSTLRLEPGSYVDERLRGSMSDLLFSIQLRDSPRRVLAYLLWEHQRTPDVYMPLRLLCYAGRALRDYTRSRGAIHGYLPPVVPILVHQGPGPWPGPTRLTDLHRIPGEPDPPTFMDLHMLVHELRDDTLPPEQLTVVARNAIRLLQAAALGTLIAEHARRIADWIAEVHGDAREDDFEAIVEYILLATKDPDLMRTVSWYVDERADPSTMTVGEQLIARGRAEGEARGRAKVLLQLLEQRFGPLSNGVRSHVRRGTIDALDRWASRLLAAVTLDDVFAEP